MSRAHTLLPWGAYQAGAGVCWPGWVLTRGPAACGGRELQGGSQWGLCAAWCSSQALNPFIHLQLLAVGFHAQDLCKHSGRLAGGRSNMDVVCALFVGCAACSCMHSKSYRD
jgi:hypothetical protein